MDKMNYSIPEACNRFGLGRAKFYELMKAGDIKYIKIGRRTLIPEESLQELQRKLQAANNPV